MDDLFPTLSDRKDVQAARILRAHQICCKLMVYNSLADGSEMGWDNFSPDFERILELTDEFVQYDKARHPDANSIPPCFHLHMGVIAPLYFVVYKCRDPQVRRRALAIISKCNHQEGPWSGPVLLPLAESVVKLEEQGLDDTEEAADVPESNRMFRAWYDLRLSNKVIYCKRRRFEVDGSWIEYQQDLDAIRET